MANPRKSKHRAKIESRPPKRAEDNFARAMRALNRAAWAYVRREIVPMLPDRWREVPAKLDGLDQAVAEAMPDHKIAALAAVAALATNRASSRAFAASVSQATGLPVIGSDMAAGSGALVRPRGVAKALARRPLVSLDLAVDALTDQSVALISTLRKGIAEGVGDSVVRAYTFGASDPDELARRLRDQWSRKGVPSKIPTRRLNGRGEPVFVSTSKHADLIARDQLQKLHGKLTEERQRAAGVTSYLWRTQEDDRVRPTHEERAGRRFKWSEPPPDGHPGEPIMCRCYADAVIDGGQVIQSEAYTLIEFEGEFSPRQSPAGIVLVDPGPGAML